MASRSAAGGTVYDGLVQVLLRDLDGCDRKAAEVLREQLTASEAEILRLLWANPLSGRPLVSVVMPTFNRAFVIAEAIQSVVDQSWTNWELLVCDDGSTDRTATVVQSFADPRVRYLKLEKANGAVARNHGLRFAQGDFLAFLDSDNVWHPNFLAMGLGLLQRKTAADLLYTGFIDTKTVRARYAEGKATYRAFDYSALLERNAVDLNTLMLRRSLYEDLGGFDETLPRVQDWDLVLRYMQLAEPLTVHAYPAFYRRNAAWGQVTDLYSHLNVNQIVRERAFERLNAGQPRLGRSPPRAVGLSIVGVGGAQDAHDALGLAVLARGLAQTRLFLPDTAEARALAALSEGDRDAELVWTPLGAGEATVTGRLWGEAVLLCDVEGAMDADRLGRGAPVARVIRREDLAELRLGCDPENLALLGALPPLDAERFVDARAEGEAGVVALLVAGDEVEAWLRALADASFDGALLIVAIDGGAGEDRYAFADAGPAGPIALAAALRLLRSRVDVVVVLPPLNAADRVHALYVALAMAGGAVVLAGASPLYAGMFRDRSAFRLARPDPDAVAALALKAQGDRDAALRVRNNGRVRHQRLYRTVAVRERLRQALLRLVEPAAPEAAA